MTDQPPPPLFADPPPPVLAVSEAEAKENRIRLVVLGAVVIIFALALSGYAAFTAHGTGAVLDGQRESSDRRDAVTICTTKLQTQFNDTYIDALGAILTNAPDRADKVAKLRRVLDKQRDVDRVCFGPLPNRNP